MHHGLNKVAFSVGCGFMGHPESVYDRLQLLLPCTAFLLRWRVEKFVQVPWGKLESHSGYWRGHIPGTNLNDGGLVDTVIFRCGGVHFDVVRFETPIVKIVGFEVMHRIRENLAVRGSLFPCVRDILEAWSTTVDDLYWTNELRPERAWVRHQYLLHP